MKKTILTVLASVALVFGAGGTANAQAVGDPEVSVDKTEAVVGELLTVTVSNLVEGGEVAVNLGDQSATGIADADGIAVIEITVPDAPGEVEGAVVVGGASVAFNVNVLAAGGEGGEAGEGGEGGEGGDGATSPLPATGPADSGTLAILAAALMLAGVGFYSISRRRLPGTAGH